MATHIPAQEHDEQPAGDGLLPNEQDLHQRRLVSQHRARHVMLHKMLDELLADWITHTNKLPSQSTCMELMEWSYAQTIEPTEGKVPGDT